MRNVTLRQLKVFECVARHASFTRAAAELHLTQPAVSLQVKELEGHAGMPLFEQVGRRIHLTPAGGEMLEHGRAILARMRVAEEAMQALRGSAGTLHVAVISAGYFFPRILGEFVRAHPGVAPDLAVVNRTELLARLADNRVDLAIMTRPPPRAHAVSAAFSPHAYVIVAAPSHPLARRKRIPLATIVREKFVVREPGSETRNVMARAFGASLRNVDIAMEIGSTETIKQAVIAGFGLSFLSAHTLALERQAGTLAVLDVQGFPLVLDWFVVHHRSKRLPPVAAHFKAFLLERGAALVAEYTRFPAKP
jgi:DNA-binding transcriptional LysR family regulator